MAKKINFRPLFVVAATVRHFDGNDENTVAMTVAYDENASIGTRVYRGLSHKWTKMLIAQSPTYVNEEGDSVEADIASLPDNTELEFDAFEVDKGYLFSEQVPPMYQVLTRDGQTTYRLVSTASGILFDDGRSVMDMVRSIMAFRLTAIDAQTGQHRYAIPSRKSIQRQLAEFWVGSPDVDYNDVMDGIVDEIDSEG